MSQLLDLAACNNCCPQIATLCVPKGSGFPFFWTFKNAAGLLDLAGYEFRQQFRTTATGLVYVTFETADMSIVNGVVTVILTAANTTGMAVGDGAYTTDLLVTPPTGEPYVAPLLYSLNVYNPASRATP